MLTTAHSFEFQSTGMGMEMAKNGASIRYYCFVMSFFYETYIYILKSNLSMEKMLGHTWVQLVAVNVAYRDWPILPAGISP